MSIINFPNILKLKIISIQNPQLVAHQTIIKNLILPPIFRQTQKLSRIKLIAAHQVIRSDHVHNLLKIDQTENNEHEITLAPNY